MMMLRKSHLLATAAAVAGALGAASAASAQSTTYVGEILKLPYNFCPIDTVPANGQLVSISQYNTLYALYGTTYGGDGVNTFGIPSMQSRISIHTGTGGGLTPRAMGQQGGTETNTQTLATMPRHEHFALVRTTSAAGNTTTPVGGKLGTTPANKYVSGTAPAAQLMNRDSFLIGNAGNGQPYEHLPPTLTIRYCVATTGIFPSQN